MDVQTQTVLVRILVIILCGWITCEAWQIQRLIGTPRFSRFAHKLFVVFGVFTVARIFSTIADSFFAFDVGWFSTITNAMFYLYFALILRKQKILIEHSEMDTSGNRRISAIITEGFEELKNIQDRLRAHQMNVG